MHHQLGVSPDLGRDQLSVVPQVPDGQTRVAGSNIRLGDGSVDVTAERRGDDADHHGRRGTCPATC